jgi:uncharacterized membrane-anchored protein
MVAVGSGELVGEGLGVRVAVAVGVNVGVRVLVALGVGVPVVVAVAVGVRLGVLVGCARAVGAIAMTSGVGEGRSPQAASTMIIRMRTKLRLISASAVTMYGRNRVPSFVDTGLLELSLHVGIREGPVR